MNGNEGGNRRAAGCQGLDDDRSIKPRQTRAADIVAHIDARHAEGGCGLQLVDREMLLLVPLDGVGRQFVAREVERHLADGFLFLRQAKIHMHVLPDRILND
ncbi:hypothetical protein D9M69_636210 [compost metagenome]